MQLNPYLQTLQSSTEELKIKTAPQKAKTQRIRAELEVSKQEETIASIEQEIHTITTCDTLDFNIIIDKLDSHALAIRRRDQLKDIITQLFPEKNA